MKLIDKRDPQTYAILGACMEIQRQLSHGSLESVDQESATVEFPLSNISYENVVLPTHYQADFICFGEIIGEFKALSLLSETEESAQSA